MRKIGSILAAELAPIAVNRPIPRPELVPISVIGSGLAAASGAITPVLAPDAPPPPAPASLARGRLYLGVGVLDGGLSGLFMARFAFGGFAARLGFAALAVCPATGACALLAIRRVAIDEHRRWMVRNFALTLAGVTLRLYIPAAVIADIDFAVVYPFIA